MDVTSSGQARRVKPVVGRGPASSRWLWTRKHLQSRNEPQCALLHAFNNCVSNVPEYTRQLTVQYILSKETRTPVRLKFCDNEEWLESLIYLSLLADLATYDTLSDNQLCKFL